MKKDFLENDLERILTDNDLTNEIVVKSGHLAARSIRGIFDVSYQDRQFGSMRVASENSQFLATTKDLKGIDSDDLIETEDGATYRVVAVYHDKTGQSVLDLAEEIEVRSW